MIINPTPRSLNGLIPWGDFWYPVSQLGREQLQTIADKIIQKQMEAYPALAAGKRKELTDAKQVDDFHRELVRVALTIGELVAYASYPTKEKAFKIEPAAWDFASRVQHDVYRSIDEGVLAIDRTAFDANSLVRELANRPLFVEKTAKDRWLGIKTPSEANQGKVAKSIIKEHQAQYGDARMRKREFIEQACDRLPGLSKLGAQNLWRDHVPAAWKKAGTKKYTSKRT